MPVNDAPWNRDMFFNLKKMLFSGILMKILLQPLSFISVILFAMHLWSCSPAEIRQERDNPVVMIDNVTFFSQEDYQCGPSSLAGVLNYWGIAVTPEEIAHDIFSEKARGTLTADMVIYAQKKGLSATQYKSGLPDLKRNLSSGYPVIILVDYGMFFYQANHFMVVVGYNDMGVFANSGIHKNRFIPENSLLKSWEKTGYWTLLIKRN